MLSYFYFFNEIFSVFCLNSTKGVVVAAFLSFYNTIKKVFEKIKEDKKKEVKHNKSAQCLKENLQIAIVAIANINSPLGTCRGEAQNTIIHRLHELLHFYFLVLALKEDKRRN